MPLPENDGLNRREWIGSAAAIALAAHGPSLLAGPNSGREPEPFGFCFNTSTIRGQKLPVPAQIDLIADAGYSAAELWIGDIADFAKRGGSLKEIAKRLLDRGLTVPSTIAFFPWICEEEEKRKQGLEQAKRDMDFARQVGALRIAAPPVGEPREQKVELGRAAERYGALCDLGSSLGVTPQLELWGFSRSISRVGQAAGIAIESGRPGACLLLDVFHIYKGGSDFRTLAGLRGGSMHVIHFNDYPARPGRREINDAARVFPGDGVAPLDVVLQTLWQIGFRGYLSLEVFNRDYWKQDPHFVARTGLKKMKECVRRALSPHA